MKIMWKFTQKNSAESHVMEIETREQVAEEFNFFEDVYDDEVWDKFIEEYENFYEIEYIEE